MLILVAVFNRQDETQTDIVTDERGFRLNRQAFVRFLWVTFLLLF